MYTDWETALQQITVSGGSFYGGVGSSPIDGGYLYFCPTGGPLYAYSYGLDGNGNPHFTPAGQIQTSPTTLACNGNPVVTSLNGQPGSGVVSRFSTISFVLNGTNLMLPGLAV
jgi:hypothetical protein